MTRTETTAETDEVDEQYEERSDVAREISWGTVLLTNTLLFLSAPAFVWASANTSKQVSEVVYPVYLGLFTILFMNAISHFIYYDAASLNNGILAVYNRIVSEFAKRRNAERDSEEPR